MNAPTRQTYRDIKTNSILALGPARDFLEDLAASNTFSTFPHPPSSHHAPQQIPSQDLPSPPAASPSPLIFSSRRSMLRSDAEFLSADFWVEENERDNKRAGVRGRDRNCVEILPHFEN